MSRPISRKTLAQKINGDISVDQLRKNEKRWGLNAARVNTGCRTVRYNEGKAIDALRRRGLA